MMIDCETIFDTEKQMMTQIYSSRVKLIVYFSCNVLLILVDDNILVQSLLFDNNYSLSDFNKYQQQAMILSNEL